MRSLIVSIFFGAFLGALVGLGVGAARSAHVAWTPELEANRGELYAQLEEPSAQSSESSAPDGKQPRVKVEEELFDFGIMEKNPSTEKGEHAFYIENVGDADMTLADGGKGCFCTDFTISKSTLRPGEKATILFKWDGARSGGVFNQGIRVLTNDPAKKELTFIVKGLYTSPIISDPPEVYFNNVSASSEASRPLRVMGFERNDDGSPFDLQIEAIEVSDPEHFEVTLEHDSLDNLTEKDKKSSLLSETANLFTGNVTMKPGMSQGAFRELIRLRTNSPKTPIYEIHLNGQIAGSTIKVTGNLYDTRTDGQLRIDKVQQSVGTSTTLRMTVQDSVIMNEQTAYVKSVRPDWLQVKMNYPPEELQKVSKIRLIDIEVQIPPGSPEGAFMGPEKEKLGEIVFVVGDSEETRQEIVIPVRFAVGK
ncbi:MAG: DUF1573 domain-containing protein [Planctomycetia bacterium]|nr:DUF1573 domain-containing protein [Planctomycetia bacterium]